MKVVQFFEGHNFHIEWHFKLGVEERGKLDQLPTTLVHQIRVVFKVWEQFVQNP
jgi:hypothetical protein